MGLKIVAANKKRNGMKDFGREFLQGRHVDCARQMRERRQLSFSLESGYGDMRKHDSR